MDMHVSSLKIAPIAASIPKMSKKEWADFVADVEKRGIVEPVKIGADGVTILDGRHRYEAAIELGLDIIPGDPADLRGLSEDDYALKAAALRRQMTEDQRAGMVAKAAGEEIDKSTSARATNAAKARTNKSADAPDTPSSPTVKKSRILEARSKESNTSIAKTKKARAIGKKSPELLEKIIAGDTSIREAEKALKENIPAPTDSISLVLPLNFEPGDHLAEFIGMIEIDYPAAVVFAWRIVEKPYKGLLFAQRVADSRHGSLVGPATDLGETLTQLSGEKTSVIRIQDLLGRLYALTLERKGTMLVVTGIAPQKQQAKG